jgi:hypothetical protein
MDPSFALTCKVTGKSKWAQEEELIMMTRKRLDALVPNGVEHRIGYTGIKMGPLSSNLFLTLS